MLGSHAERDEFEKYDLEHGIRRKFVEDLQREFPDYGLKYSIGTARQQQRRPGPHVQTYSDSPSLHEHGSAAGHPQVDKSRSTCSQLAGTRRTHFSMFRTRASRRSTFSATKRSRWAHVGVAPTANESPRAHGRTQEGKRPAWGWARRPGQGGNDFEIYHHPSVTGHAVTSPHDTIKVLHDLFLS